MFSGVCVRVFDQQDFSRWVVVVMGPPKGCWFKAPLSCLCSKHAWLLGIQGSATKMRQEPPPHLFQALSTTRDMLKQSVSDDQQASGFAHVCIVCPSANTDWLFWSSAGTAGPLTGCKSQHTCIITSSMQRAVCERFSGIRLTAPCLSPCPDA